MSDAQDSRSRGLPGTLVRAMSYALQSINGRGEPTSRSLNESSDHDSAILFRSRSDYKQDPSGSPFVLLGGEFLPEHRKL